MEIATLGDGQPDFEVARRVVKGIVNCRLFERDVVMPKTSLVGGCHAHHRGWSRDFCSERLARVGNGVSRNESVLSHHASRV